MIRVGKLFGELKMAAVDVLLRFDDEEIDQIVLYEQSDELPPERSALHEAAAAGDAWSLNAVAAVAADVDIPDARGFTPLHIAASAGHARSVAALLAHGARADARSRCRGAYDGCTALHCAVAAGHAEVVDVLLAAGADPDARDECGYTALHLASELGHRDLVRRLLKSGARVDALVADETPLGLATRQRHMEAAALLQMVGGKL